MFWQKKTRSLCFFRWEEAGDDEEWGGLGAAFSAKELILGQGRILKARVINAWDPARVQAEVTEWIEGKTLSHLSMEVLSFTPPEPPQA